jgi:hypothetical protein
MRAFDRDTSVIRASRYDAKKKAVLKSREGQRPFFSATSQRRSIDPQQYSVIVDLVTTVLLRLEIKFPKPPLTFHIAETREAALDRLLHGTDCYEISMFQMESHGSRMTDTWILMMAFVNDSDSWPVTSHLRRRGQQCRTHKSTHHMKMCKVIICCGSRCDRNVTHRVQMFGCHTQAIIIFHVSEADDWSCSTDEAERRSKQRTSM